MHYLLNNYNSPKLSFSHCVGELYVKRELQYIEPLYTNATLIFRRFCTATLIWVETNKKALQLCVTGLLVPGAGLEPARAFLPTGF